MGAHVIESPAFETRECFDCGAMAVRRRIEKQQFEYGHDGAVRTLEAEVPVWRCASCGAATTDGEAEDRRHEAVCRHLGVLPPREIERLRKARKLTQARLAELTGLGEASIKRWEAGTVIQNAASDILVRIALCAEGAALLKCMMAERNQVRVEPHFRTELSQRVRDEARVFELHRRAG